MSNSESRVDGFRVEVRTCYHTPHMAAGQIIDAEWRTLQVKFGDDVMGIQCPDGPWTRRLKDHGLMTRNQAEAIRFWFLSIAEAERVSGALCIETRLVRHRLTETVTVTREEEMDALDYRGRVITKDEVAK